MTRFAARRAASFDTGPAALEIASAEPLSLGARMALLAAAGGASLLIAAGGKAAPELPAAPALRAARAQAGPELAQAQRQWREARPLREQGLMSAADWRAVGAALERTAARAAALDAERARLHAKLAGAR